MRVAIISNIRLYREGLADLLAQRGFEVVATAADGMAAVDCVRRTLPEVVVLDMAMLDSAATVRALVDVSPAVRVLAVAVPETERHVLACVEAGVVGYVPRDGSLDDLTDALRRVLRGEVACSPKIAASLLRRVAELAARPRAPIERLTAREVEILQLIDRGLSNKEIARRLCIELSTVKNHVHNILRKLHVRRRIDAAVWGRQHQRPSAHSPIRELDLTS
jgi:two-component system, NarL family, nitrate/nitrite response regulator NarL